MKPVDDVAERVAGRTSGIPVTKVGFKKMKASLKLRTRNPW